MRAEEDNRLKDKQTSITSISIKANLIEFISGFNDRFKNNDKKIHKDMRLKKTTPFKSGQNKFQKMKCKLRHKAYQCKQDKINKRYITSIMLN